MPFLLFFATIAFLLGDRLRDWAAARGDGVKPEGATGVLLVSLYGGYFNGGLGIVISIRDAKLTIISPLDDTPASRAGLEAGDVISRIGDVKRLAGPFETAPQRTRTIRAGHGDG